MNRNTILIIIIGSFSSLCYTMQQQGGLFPNLSQPRTSFQQNPMQQTNVTIANSHQMHGAAVPQNVLNNLSGVDAIIAQRHNDRLASQKK